MMSLRLAHVDCSYHPGRGSRRPALRDVTLTIDAGSCVGIIGPEGSGKSTLLFILAGLLRPDAGTVSVGGRDIWTDSQAARHARVQTALSFQFPSEQFVAMTVMEELRLTAGHLTEAEVLSTLSSVGLDPDRYRDRSPFGLSMGEARRVALTSVLLRKPRLLLLDEPTVGLDAFGARTLEHLLRMEQQRGTTVVIASHDLDFLAENATSIVGLSDGRVGAGGAVDAILTDAGILSQLGYEEPDTVQLARSLAEAGRAEAGRFLRPRELRRILRAGPG